VIEVVAVTAPPDIVSLFVSPPVTVNVVVLRVPPLEMSSEDP